MRLTVRQPTAQGLPLTAQGEEDTDALREAVVRALERRQWL
jgi:hypothetical protein